MLITMCVRNLLIKLNDILIFMCILVLLAVCFGFCNICPSWVFRCCVVQSVFFFIYYRPAYVLLILMSVLIFYTRW